MKQAPTLIDHLYRLSFQRELIPGWQSNSEMRRALHSAKRFVVSEKMSAFMADLATEAFKLGKAPTLAQRRYSHRVADSLRVSSRLPHEVIWIEYRLHAYQVRSHVLRNKPPPNLPEIPELEGWLIQQHPKIETACLMHLFTQSDRVHDDGYDTWTFPFAFAWTCDGSPLPWKKMFEPDPNRIGFEPVSACLTGLRSYDYPWLNCVYSPLIEDPSSTLTGIYMQLLLEWTGIIRRVWALLATIDHLPLTRGAVRTGKGFLARGQIRKYLDHQTITLNIPGKKDTRVLARKMIAIAHRKRHEVRAHWRDDYRHLPSSTCNPHLWELLDTSDSDTIECVICRGRQFHIAKHLRGDAALGFTIHDYKVKHDEEATT
jgi:hypothetical protein